MSVPPISPAAALLRAQVVQAAEASLVASVGRGQDLEVPETPQAAREPLPDPLQQAVATARTAAAARQSGMAPLFAELGRALQSPTLTPPVRAAITQLMSLPLQTSRPVTGEAVQQAVARSGLFLEATLAAPQPPPGPDLKAALLILRQVLKEAQPEAPLQGRPANSPPPSRDGVLSGQPPATATLRESASLAVIAQRLGGDAEQAIARQVLHQLASLPEAGSSIRTFELPLATPQGAAIAQFEIDHDGSGGGAPGGPPVQTWRVRFSIDLEPLGPVHVQLGTGPERAAVTFWAERPETLGKLRAKGHELAGALHAEVQVLDGAPRRPPPPSGHLLDQSL